MTEVNTTQLTVREKMALRILAVMYRLIQPHGFEHKTTRDIVQILEGADINLVEKFQ